MRAPLLRVAQSSDSWLTRIRENLSQLFSAAELRGSSANGAPIHLLKFEKTGRPRRAQAISLATHAALLSALAIAVTHTQVQKPGVGPKAPFSKVLHFPREILRGLAAHPFDGGGKGGDKNPIPATHGNLPPLSSIQLIKPSLPQNQNHALPMPPTILDANAPSVLTSVDKLGLPWMRDDSNSEGPGDRHTIGSAPGNTMGYGGSGQAGEGGPDGYWRGGTLPSCAYCPLPLYTDEARQVRTQGIVTLRVLVGADGRASDIRVVRGIGYGLEERAMQTVRAWKFNPARNSNHRPAAAWVIIEVVFRLF